MTCSSFNAPCNASDALPPHLIVAVNDDFRIKDALQKRRPAAKGKINTSKRRQQARTT